MENKRSNTKIKEWINKWISRLDEQDRELDSKFRKGKWMGILLGFMLLFAASFIWLPIVGSYKGEILSPIISPLEPNQNEIPRPSFEIPIDSFELHLKKNIHENRSEKK